MRPMIAGALFAVGVSCGGGIAAATLEEADAAMARRDYLPALQAYRALAEQGDAAAQASLGTIYGEGRIVPRDDAEALKWMRMSAEQGRADAQAGLAFMYMNGRGTPRDHAAALTWARKSAEGGDRFGQHILGIMYFNGFGVPQDDAEALVWVRKSADNGFDAAHVSLGYMYRDGRGVARDDAEAVRWFRKAAEQGHPDGQVNLGHSYAEGRGLPRDETEAVSWYRKAAEQGEPEGQASLGIMYRDGRGLPQDLAEAVRWLRRASVQGNAKAKQALAALEKFDPAPAVATSPAVPAITGGAPDLASSIAQLVKSIEDTLPPSGPVDGERAALARDVVAETLLGARPGIEASSDTWQQSGFVAVPGELMPQTLAAHKDLFLAVFRPEPMRMLIESKLAESLDAEILRAGLAWDRSDLARRIRTLEHESETPEQLAALREFALPWLRKGTMPGGDRSRACGQVDILSGKSEAVLPVIETLSVGWAILVAAQRSQPQVQEDIARLFVAMRPLFRDTMRQAWLATCLFIYRDLGDAEFGRWLEFLRSDLGGRYERGKAAAVEAAFRQRTEIYVVALRRLAPRIVQTPKA